MLIDLKLLALFGLVPISTSKLTALISITEICSLDLEVELIEAIQGGPSSNPHRQKITKMDKISLHLFINAKPIGNRRRVVLEVNQPLTR